MGERGRGTLYRGYLFLGGQSAAFCGGLGVVFVVLVCSKIKDIAGLSRKLVGRLAGSSKFFFRFYFLVFILWERILRTCSFHLTESHLPKYFSSLCGALQVYASLFIF